MQPTRSMMFLVAAATAALLVGGCQREGGGPSASQKPDQAMPKIADSGAGTAANVAGATDDAVITAKVKAALIAEPGLKALNINVETNGATVTLSGNVDNADLRERARQVASTTAGVKGVIDNLVVKTTS